MARGDYDLALAGGYWTMVGFAVFVVLIGGFVSSFYLYISKKSGDIYRELADTKVIDENSENVLKLINGANNSIYAMHNRLRWLALAVCLVIFAVIVTIYMQFLATNIADVTRYRSLGVLMSMPVWLTGIYMLAMIVTRTNITIWGLFKVLRVEQIGVHPIHPDHCGGTGPIRNYALAISYFIAVFGIGIVLFGFITSQGPDLCFSQLKEEGVVRLKDACDGKLDKLKDMKIVVQDEHGRLLVIKTELAKAAKRVQTNLDRPLGLAPMWIFAGFYVIAAPVASFGTIFVAHEPMRKVKYALIQKLSDQFNEEYNIVHGNIGARAIVSEQRFNNLRRINELRGITESFPVWSLDPGSIRKFLAANAPALVIAGLRVFLKRVLS